MKVSAWIRVFLMECICVEMTRCYSITLVPLMPLLKVLLSLLRKIEKLQATRHTIGMYAQIQCILKCGEEAQRLIAATLMSVGFGLCVLGLWALIQGWKIFPLLVYLLFSAVFLAIYTIVLFSLPCIVKVYKETTHLLCVVWKQQCFGKSLFWRKQLRAQRPISFSYG